MTPNTPASPFSFGDPVEAPAKKGGDNARMAERRTLAQNIAQGASAAVTAGQLDDGKELPVALTADVLKRHNPAQVSRAINDGLDGGGHDGPFYARYDKGADQVRIVKGKRPVRKSSAKKGK